MRARKWFLIVMAVIVAAGILSAYPTVALAQAACPSAPARLNANDIAVVSDQGGPGGLNLRVQPGLNEKIIESIPLYAYVTIIAGPTCQDGYRWYEVGFQGQDGWSAEVGADGIYNLVPNGQQMPAVSSPSQPNTQNQSSSQQTDVWPNDLIGVWEGQISCINNQNNKCDIKVVITRDANNKMEISVYQNSTLIGSGIQQKFQGCTGWGICSPEYDFTGNFAVVIPDRANVLMFVDSVGGYEDLKYISEPTAQDQTQTTQPPATQAPVEPGQPQTQMGQESLPVSSSCSALAQGQWWNPFNPPEVGAEEQCTQFVNRLQTAISDCWGPNHYPDGGQYADWARDPSKYGVKSCGWAVYPSVLNGTVDFSKAQPGDLITWNVAKENNNRNCAGANYDHGHVAIFEGLNNDGTIRVTESNWDRDHNKVPVDPTCMNIIHIPSVVINTQPSNQRTDYCAQFNWWEPNWWFCKVTNFNS